MLLTDLTQSCELLGKPLLLKKEDGEVLLNQRIIKIESKDSLDKIFLMNFFLTENYHKIIKETSSGSTVRHSSNKIINNVLLTYPDLIEQTKIANFLTALDDKISHAQAQLAAVKQYKQGLLQQMFV